MGVLNWLRGRLRGDQDHEEPYVRGDGSYPIELVGEERYQDNLHEIVGGHHGAGVEVCATAALKAEHREIGVNIDGLTVGYLNRTDGMAFQKRLASEGNPEIARTCSALIVGGWDDERGRGRFHVRLDLPSSADQMNALRNG